jgi:hypothetical protein
MQVSRTVYERHDPGLLKDLMTTAGSLTFSLAPSTVLDVRTRPGAERILCPDNRSLVPRSGSSKPKSFDSAYAQSARWMSASDLVFSYERKLIT